MKFMDVPNYDSCKIFITQVRSRFDPTSAIQPIASSISNVAELKLPSQGKGILFGKFKVLRPGNNYYFYRKGLNRTHVKNYSQSNAALTEGQIAGG